VARLGVTEGRPVTTGFVFVDGRYLEPPYVVVRRGLQVTINGVVVHEWKRWPSPDLRVDEKPELPAGITETSGFEDFGKLVTNWWDTYPTRVSRYYYQHFPPDEAAKRITEDIRSLPFVESVALERPDRLTLLTVRTKAGRTVSVDIGERPRDSALSWRFGDKELVERLDGTRALYERRLTLGMCWFAFSGGAELSLGGGRRGAAESLGLVVEILRSGRSAEEKMRLLERMDFLPPRELARREDFAALFEHFQALPSLDQRLAELVRETGVTPRRIEDIPEEGEAERLLRQLRERQEQKAPASAPSEAPPTSAPPS